MYLMSMMISCSRLNNFINLFSLLDCMKLKKELYLVLGIIILVAFASISLPKTGMVIEEETAISYKEEIYMKTTCTFRYAEISGYNTEDLIKFDCNRACRKINLTFIDHGCPDDQYYCYCD